MPADLDALVAAISAQTLAIGKLAEAIGESHLDHEGRIRSLEATSIQVKERLSIWQLAQVGYTTVASAIAAAISFMRR